MIYEILLVGSGGFIGSILRYGLGCIRIYESTFFPINTFIINLLGTIVLSFTIFYITSYALKRLDVTTVKFLVLFLTVGVCGGFTTFSTFAMETGSLIKSGQIEIALLYSLLTVVAGVVVIFLPDLMFKYGLL